MDTAYDTDFAAHFVPPNVSPGHDKRLLLRYALATASIYGICGCGPSGPAPKFAGANFANPPPTSRNGPHLMRG